MGITIRPAVAEDAFAACEVLRRSITECCVQDHRNDPQLLAQWLGNKTPQNVAGWFDVPSNYTIVAEQAGKVVGVALLTQAGKLSLCYVLPEAHGAGAGKAMLAAVEAQARSWGVAVLKMNSTTTARDFYAHHGYVCAGKEKSCYGLECDFMWKKLDAEPAATPAKSTRFCSCTAK
jgi:GNAT superfamily N-acetyltransferase